MNNFHLTWFQKRRRHHKHRTKSAWQKFEDHMTPILVVFSFTIVLTFSVVVMILAGHGIEVSSTLIEYFYKFFGFELLALSGIKISKHIGSAFGKVESSVDGSECLEEELEESEESEETTSETSN